MNCGGIDNIAATHKNNNLKPKVIIPWKAPTSAVSGPVEFKFSVVEEYTKFWVKMPAASTVTVLAGSSAPEPVPEAEEPTPTPEDQQPEQPASYQGCGSTHGCFGIPQDCTSKGSCLAFLAYTYLKDVNQYKFLLHAKTTETSKYIAMGLSNDEDMGSDLVIFCPTATGGQVGARWNSGKSNVGGVTGLNFVDTQPSKNVDGVSLSFHLTFS